jgi:tetratricopeptide (TPR) repeat protein
VRAWALLGDVARAAELLDAMEKSRAPAPDLFEPLAQTMRFDEALALAERLGFNGAGGPALDAIAQALLRPGPGTDVAGEADRILTIAAHTRPSQTSPELLGMVSHALALAGASRPAVRVADRALTRLRTKELGIGGERALGHALATYAHLGVLPAKAERLVRAVKRFEKVDDQTTAATAIARAILHNGDADTALRAIAPVLTPPVIDDDLEAYAQAQALNAFSVAASRAGRTQLALELAGQAWTAAAAIEYYQGEVGGKADKDGALADAARAFAVAGDYDTALEHARVIDLPLKHMGILLEVARRADRAGATNPIAAAARAASLTAKEQVSGIRAAFLHCGAALVLATAGDARGALREVDRVLALEPRFENPANKALVWSLAAEALAGAQEAGRAAEITERGIASAREHPDPEARLWALLGCAHALLVLGQRDRAADIAEKALQHWEATQQASDHSYVPLYLSDMARFNELFSFTDEQDGGRAPAILTCAALTLVDAGSLPAARDAANRAVIAAQASDEPSRAGALATVAGALTATGEQRQATALVRDALTLAGHTSRQALLHVLRLGTATITAADAGELLEHTGRAVLEIASWWPLAAASRLPGDDSGFWEAVVGVAGMERFE